MTANIKQPVDFLYENLTIQNNVISQAYLTGVKKMVFFSSNCVYPRMCLQPIKEDYFLSGPPEPTNEAYAIAKIAGMKLCESYNRQYGTKFVSVVPASLYGPNDHFNDDRAHAIPTLITKIHEAKINGLTSLSVDINPRKIREFIYTDDVADAVVYLMSNIDLVVGQKISFLNIGTGEQNSVGELAELIKKIIGFNGEIRWTNREPEGMPSKILDSGKINSLGWHYKVSLGSGLEKTYQWFLSHQPNY